MRNKSLLGAIQELRIFGSDNRCAQMFDSNPHLDWLLLAIPFLFVAVYFDAFWAALMAAGIWLAVFVYHLFDLVRKRRR